MTSDNCYEILGSRLRELRHTRKWSLRHAAKTIGGISHSRLQDFERGRDPHSAIPTRPTEEQIHRIARAYTVEPAELLRLAGYSAIKDITEEEEDILVRIRALKNPLKYQLLLKCLETIEEPS